MNFCSDSDIPQTNSDIFLLTQSWIRLASTFGIIEQFFTSRGLSLTLHHRLQNARRNSPRQESLIALFRHHACVFLHQFPLRRVVNPKYKKQSLPRSVVRTIRKPDFRIGKSGLICRVKNLAARNQNSSVISLI